MVAKLHVNTDEESRSTKNYQLNLHSFSLQRYDIKFFSSVTWNAVKL